MFCGYQLKFTEQVQSGGAEGDKIVIERRDFIQNNENVTRINDFETKKNTYNHMKGIKDVQEEKFEEKQMEKLNDEIDKKLNEQFKREMEDHEREWINDMEKAEDIVMDTKEGNDIVYNNSQNNNQVRIKLFLVCWKFITFQYTCKLTVSLLLCFQDMDTCERKTRIVYIKTHKTGSCTTTNMLYRYSQKLLMIKLLPI